MTVSQIAQADAQSRAEAANFSSFIVQQMRLKADHSSTEAVFKTSLATFQHLETKANPATAPCTFTGTASSVQTVIDWVASVRTGAGHLPGSTAAMQQILVDTSAASGMNKVTVTVCWQSPNDVAPRRQVYSAYVNANFN
jgi:dihydroxyacid dehydratase/phosphogluconate dehydratase